VYLEIKVVLSQDCHTSAHQYLIISRSNFLGAQINIMEATNV